MTRGEREMGMGAIPLAGDRAHSARYRYLIWFFTQSALR